MRTRIEARKGKKAKRRGGSRKKKERPILEKEKERNIQCNTTGTKEKASQGHMSICNRKESILMVKEIHYLRFPL